jgi:hypothetical protein
MCGKEIERCEVEEEDYRNEIIKMVQNVKQLDILIYIYNISKDIISEDK